jgi:hypothetical protein
MTTSLIPEAPNIGVLSGLLLLDRFNNQFQLMATVNGQQIQKAAKVANIVSHGSCRGVRAKLKLLKFVSGVVGQHIRGESLVATVVVLILSVTDGVPVWCSIYFVHR